MQQLLVAHHFWIVNHAYRFGMPGLAAAHFAVGRVWRVAAGVACGGAVDPFALPEEAFHAPETAHRENRHLHPLRDVCHRVLVNSV